MVRDSGEARESCVVVSDVWSEREWGRKGELCGSVRRVVRESGEERGSCVVVSDVWSEREGKEGRAVW